MRIIKSKVNDRMNMLTITDINVEDHQSMQTLETIIKTLTKGDAYYFHFKREDYDFLTDEEIKVYRRDVSKYFNKHGMYEVKTKLDEGRFESIAYLPIDEDTYSQIPSLWKYFYSILFFTPKGLYSWEEYRIHYEKAVSQKYAINIIENKYSDSVFIKGHDGDNLIFVYNNDYNQDLIKEIENIV